MFSYILISTYDKKVLQLYMDCKVSKVRKSAIHRSLDTMSNSVQSMSNVPSLMEDRVIFKKIKKYEQLLLNVSKGEKDKSAEVRRLKTVVMHLQDYIKNLTIHQQKLEAICNDSLKEITRGKVQKESIQQKLRDRDLTIKCFVSDKCILSQKFSDLQRLYDDLIRKAEDLELRLYNAEQQLNHSSICSEQVNRQQRGLSNKNVSMLTEYRWIHKELAYSSRHQPIQNQHQNSQDSSKFSIQVQYKAQSINKGINSHGLIDTLFQQRDYLLSKSNKIEKQLALAEQQLKQKSDQASYYRKQSQKMAVQWDDLYRQKTCLQVNYQKIKQEHEQVLKQLNYLKRGEQNSSTQLSQSDEQFLKQSQINQSDGYK